MNKYTYKFTLSPLTAAPTKTLPSLKAAQDHFNRQHSSKVRLKAGTNHGEVFVFYSTYSSLKSPAKAMGLISRSILQTNGQSVNITSRRRIFRVL